MLVCLFIYYVILQNTRQICRRFFLSTALFWEGFQLLKVVFWIDPYPWYLQTFYIFHDRLSIVSPCRWKLIFWKFKYILCICHVRSDGWKWEGQVTRLRWARLQAWHIKKVEAVGRAEVGLKRAACRGGTLFFRYFQYKVSDFSWKTKHSQQ